MKIQTEENRIIIFHSCKIMIVFSGLAYWYQDFILSFLYMIVFLTSYLHWRNPVRNSAIQTMDRCVVSISSLVSLVRSFLLLDTEWRVFYSTLFLFALWCYWNALFEHHPTTSMYWHLSMHGLGHTCNCVLLFRNHCIRSQLPDL